MKVRKVVQFCSLVKYKTDFVPCIVSQFHTALYYTLLYYTILYCTVLYGTLLYFTVQYCTVLFCTILYYWNLCLLVPSSCGHNIISPLEILTRGQRPDTDIHSCYGSPRLRAIHS